MRGKKKQRDLSVGDVTPVIEEVIRRLPNGDDRLMLSQFRLSNVCLRGLSSPDMVERISSDYGMPPSTGRFYRKVGDEYEEIAPKEVPATIANRFKEEIEAVSGQFYEEVETIQTVAREMDIVTYTDSFDGRALAFRLWDCYAIPWRFVNESVYVIWSPHDLAGSPVIHAYPVTSFLRELVERVQEYSRKDWKQAKHLRYWKTFGIGALIAVVSLAWVIVAR